LLPAQACACVVFHLRIIVLLSGETE